MAAPAAKHGTPQFPRRRIGVKGDASKTPRPVTPGQAGNLAMNARSGKPAVTGPPALPGGSPLPAAGGARLAGAGAGDADPCRGA